MPFCAETSTDFLDHREIQAHGGIFPAHPHPCLFPIEKYREHALFTITFTGGLLVVMTKKGDRNELNHNKSNPGNIG